MSPLYVVVMRKPLRFFNKAVVKPALNSGPRSMLFPNTVTNVIIFHTFKLDCSIKYLKYEYIISYAVFNSSSLALMAFDAAVFNSENRPDTGKLVRRTSFHVKT